MLSIMYLQNWFGMARSIHLFKITGMLTPENVKLKRNKLWDVIELDWRKPM